MDRKRGSCLCPGCNGLEWRKFLSCLEWSGLKDWFWPDWNVLDWRKLLLFWLEYIGMTEAGTNLSRLDEKKLGLTGMDWNEESYGLGLI
jgi:hypothetical protein